MKQKKNLISLWSVFFFAFFFHPKSASGQAEMTEISERGFKKKIPFYSVCEGKVVILSTHKIRFTPLEKTFLCGDAKVSAWEKIPLSQRKFHMTNFLQARGYHHPVFDEDGDTLCVTLNEPTPIGKITVIGAPASFNINKRRQNIGTLLTPKFLNELEKWVLRKLQSQGYACPEIQILANPDTGDIFITIQAGFSATIESIHEEATSLKPGIIRRFDAFRFYERYNQDFLNLTTNRIQQKGFLQGNYFIPECDDGTFELTQKMIEGKPHLVTIGFGANTEGLVLVKGGWKHTRLGAHASLFEVNAYASYKKQQVDVSTDWYAFSPQSRFYLFPLLSFDHERESQFHFISGNIKTALATTWDNQALGFTASVGPNLNFIDTFKGAQEGLTHFLSLQYQFDLMSHYFEYFLRDPRTGYHIRLTGDLTHEKTFSEVSAQRFRLEWEYLYNLLDYDLPLLIIGTRGGFYQTFVGKNITAASELPPVYRYYLGGSADLRGWGRQELPNENGALSAGFASVEMRLAHVLPGGFQPFVFMDAAVMGDEAFHFSLPVYTSPGAGMRYHSPIGIFRATIAHGYKWGGNTNSSTDNHWQYYFSFGEEF